MLERVPTAPSSAGVTGSVFSLAPNPTFSPSVASQTLQPLPTALRSGPSQLGAALPPPGLLSAAPARGALRLRPPGATCRRNAEPRSTLPAGGGIAGGLRLPACSAAGDAGGGGRLGSFSPAPPARLSLPPPKTPTPSRHRAAAPFRFRPPGAPSSPQRSAGPSGAGGAGSSRLLRGSRGHLHGPAVARRGPGPC